MEIKLDTLIKRRKLTDYILYSLIILLGIALDQLTKLLTVKYLGLYDTVPIIDGVIHFTHSTNDGCAFGMLDDVPYVFNTISILVIGAMTLALYFGHIENRLTAIASAMIVSGGIGNMIDRISFGEVTDFIDFRLINFAIFNGADSFVCVGAGLLILSLVLELINEEKGKVKKK